MRGSYIVKWRGAGRPGQAPPLVLIAAIIAIGLLGNTLAQFSRAHPSTGGFSPCAGSRSR